MNRLARPLRLARAALALLGLTLLAPARPAIGQGVTLKVTVDGVERTALVYPGKDAANTPSPLVFVFHGLTGSASQASSFGVHRAWPEATVVYPQGLNVRLRAGVSGTGWQSAPGDDNDRDLRFVDALQQALATAYKVDEERVYAAGFSVGAWFTYVLLTAHPDRFAAFAPVDGCLEPFAKWAALPRPVLIITNSNACGTKLAYEERQITWARRLNGCGLQLREWVPGYYSFEPCESGQPVVWHRNYGDHQWPPDASRNIVLFFKEHALSEIAHDVRPQGLGPEGTVAGTGTSGASPNGTPASAAQLSYPEGVAVDRTGILWIADTFNSRVRQVIADGTLNTAVGNGVWEYPPAVSGDKHGATTVQLFFPEGIVLDGQGNLYIADSYNARVRKVSPGGTTVTVAGSGLDGYFGDGGPGVLAGIYFPTAVAVDAVGNLFVADTGNQRIRKVSTNGTITTLAGTGVVGFAGDGGPATSAQLYEPRGLALDGQGNLFVADSYNHRIRKVSVDGTISAVAGTGRRGFSGDGGPAAAAQLNFPEGVAVDSAGNLFIADSANHRVRKVTPDGMITTVAGENGGTVVAVPLSYPEGLAVDRAGILYMADPVDHRVRKITGVAAPGLLAGQPFPNP
jgi:sugar lactone lactonase YvrE/predicted esterase